MTTKTIDRKPARELRELSLEDLEIVAGGGELCIGLKIKSICLGLSAVWG
jgi:hypothetical protein